VSKETQEEILQKMKDRFKYQNDLCMLRDEPA